MPDRFNPSSVMRARQTQFNTRAEGDALIVEGYFVVFNQPYLIDDYAEEIVLPGAFDSSTDMADVRALVDHVPHLVLGRTIVDTLRMSFDDTGLFATIQINAHDTDAVNLHARTQRGDVDQASFGFDEDLVAYADLPDGRVQRQIQHISKLWEISVCTFPAYEQTFVTGRSRTDAEIRAEVLRAKKEQLIRRFKHA